MTQEGARDYIGSARIPLRELRVRKDMQQEVQICDEYSGITGRVQVRVAI